MWSSGPESFAGFSGELHFFNAKNTIVNRVINIGEIFQSGSLSDSSELIINK